MCAEKLKTQAVLQSIFHTGKSIMGGPLQIAACSSSYLIHTMEASIVTLPPTNVGSSILQVLRMRQPEKHYVLVLYRAWS